MKKFLHKTWLTMVCLLVFGAGSAWAENYTITFKTNTSDGTTTIAANTKVADVVSAGTSYVSGFTSTCSKAYHNSINGVKLGTSSATGTLEFNVATNYQSNIKSIIVKSVKYGSDTGTITLYNGSTSLKTGITPGSDYTYTFTTVTTVSSIKLSTSSKRAYISEIVLVTDDGSTPSQFSYTLETVGSGTTTFKDGNGNTIAANQKVNSGTKICPTFTPADGYEFTSWEYYTSVGEWSQVNSDNFTITKDVKFRVTYTATAPKAKYPVTIVTPENGTLTIKDGENEINSGDEVEEGKTLSVEVTPDAGYKFKNWGYKDGDASWVGNMTSTFTHVMPSAPCSFKATFEAIPVYTVAFNVNGIEKQSGEYEEGATVTAPAVDDINNMKFVGWVKTATVDAESTPTYEEIKTATEDATYYAVFAEVEGEGGDEATSISSYADGKYIIVDVYDNKYYAMNGEITAKNAIAATEITDAVTVNSNGTISLDLSNAVIANSMKYDLAHENSEYVIKYGDNKIYLQAKGNNLTTSATSGTSTILDNFVWTGFEEGTDDKAGRFSITTNGTNSNSNATNNCILMQASNWNSKTSAQEPTLIFKGYTQSNRGSITAKAQCYASGYMWFVPVEGGSSYSNFTTLPNGYYREVTEGNYGTICLPCATTNVEGATFYNIAGKTETGIVLEEVEGNLAAGTPYIFKATAGLLIASYTGDAAVEPVEAYGLVGNLSTTALSVPLDSYVLSNNKIRKVNGGTASVGQNRAYIDLTNVADPTESNKKAVFFGFDGTIEEGVVTGIFSVATDNNESIYNLQGQRISRLQKGVNIVNGKKVIR